MTTRRDLILGGSAMLGGYVLGKPVRSALGGKSEAAKSGWQNPYATDGLVAHWDGEWNAAGGIHDAGANAWKDLAGSNNLTVNGSWGDDYLQGSANTDFSLYMDACNSLSMTLEICATVANGRLFYCNGGNTWYSADGIPYKWLRLHDGLDGVGAYLPTLGTPFLASIVLGTSHRLWINGVDVKSINYTPSKPVTTTYFRVGDSVIKIFGVRLYNKPLRANEIQANYQVDKRRFGL